MRPTTNATLCAVTMLAASQASAATQVFEASAVGSALLPKFDGSLGTLTSVAFDNDYSLTFFVADYGLPVIHVVGTLGNPGLGETNIDENVQSVPGYYGGAAVSFGVTIKQTYTDNLSDYVAGGSGFGGVPYLFVGFGGPFELTYLDGSPTTPFFPGVNNSGVTGRVTFTYDEAAPFVPELATWAMMLVGFAMTGYALRRRSRLSYAT